MQKLKQKKQKLPICNYILLRDTHATVTNLEYWHTLHHEMAIEAPIAVEAKTFLAIIKGRNEADIAVHSGGQVFHDHNLIGQVATLPAEDFPTPPEDVVTLGSIQSIDIKSECFDILRWY